MKSNFTTPTYNCNKTELTDGQPPKVDDNGVPVKDSSICYILDTDTKTVTSIKFFDIILVIKNLDVFSNLKLTMEK
jgi:hypothetical protein